MDQKAEVKGGENQGMKIQLHDIKGTCAILGGISPASLYRLIGEKKIQPVKIGGRTMFTERDICDFVRKSRETSIE